MKEWFTIAELRASRLASMTEARLKRLTERFGNLSPSRSRTRVSGNILEAEFHILVFPAIDQIALRRAEPTIDIARRIYRLGIHRAVDVESVSYNRGNADTAALIDGVERLKAERRRG